MELHLKRKAERQALLDLLVILPDEPVRFISARTLVFLFAIPSCATPHEHAKSGRVSRENSTHGQASEDISTCIQFVNDQPDRNTPAA
jgi:hypothetical protein